MWVLLAGLVLMLGSASVQAADDSLQLADRAQRYLVDLVKIDTSNSPGNETRVAEYLRQVATANGIPSELIGDNPKRLNFVARLKGTGKLRPLLLVAHSDTIPADKSQWTFDPWGAELKNGFIQGRGSLDAKSLLAAELAVLIEIKNRSIPLSRDVILLSESDEEVGASGIQWMIQHAYSKIDAEFALNEGGYNFDANQSRRMFQVQTSEKIPTRIVLTAKGTQGTGSLPRSDNAMVRASRALLRLVDSDQPVRLSATTRRYFQEVSKLPTYEWLAPLVPRLENPFTAAATANQIRAKNPELEVMIRTSISPTYFRSGSRFNIIPNAAEVTLDVRRLPNETRDEVLARFRQIINDPMIEVALAVGPQMPSTEASSMTTSLYKAMENVVSRLHPDDLVIPYLGRGSTDGAYLRAKGMPVYGVPLFEIDPADNRFHGIDERIAEKNLQDGTEMLWQIVLEVSSGGSQ